jgi:AcrR family transcriptional regulator
MEEETGPSPRQATPRGTGAARRRQIARVTMELVGQHGVQGATVSRIAAAVGVTAKALYNYFPSRTDMLLAALDLAFAEGDSMYKSCRQENILERLRAQAQVHWQLVAQGEKGFVYPLYEFMAAPAGEGLRERLRMWHLTGLTRMKALVEEGKSQGVIRGDVDADQIAWELIGVWQTQDVNHLMGSEDLATAERSAAMVDRILRDVSA